MSGSPKIGFYVSSVFSGHFAHMKKRRVILELEGFTKSGMMKLKEWVYYNNSYFHADLKTRKKPIENSVSYPLKSDEQKYNRSYFYFSKAKYYPSLDEVEEDLYHVEGEKILI